MRITKRKPFVRTLALSPPRGSARSIPWLLLLGLSCLLILWILFALSFVPVAAQSRCGNSVTVVPGDTLREIANRCDASISGLLAANPQIRNRNLIYPGQVLTIPNQSGETPGEQTVSITPVDGPVGTAVRLVASGFAPNTPVEIGFGQVESEYDVIARAATNANGALDRQIQVPSFAEPNERFVFSVTPDGTSTETFSNVFTVTGENPPKNPQVTISPRSGPPGSNVQVAVSDFPGYTRINYGLGEPGGQLLKVFSARTNREGSAQMTLQVPDVATDTVLEVLVYVSYEGSSARSAPFTVTARDNNGDNLFSRTNIYLVALEDAGRSGMEIGCGDSVVPVEVAIEPTIAPLTAALGVLFNIDERYYGQSGLYNALYRSDLTVDHIEIVDGVASLYLTGTLQVGGLCDQPRIRAQLEETALQYYTVDEVRIYINSEPLSF